MISLSKLLLTFYLILFQFNNNVVRCSQITPVNGFPDVLRTLSARIRAAQTLSDDRSSHLETFSALKQNLNSRLSNLTSLEEELGQNVELNQTQCGRDVLFMVVSTFLQKYWALSMLDSFGKLGSGILDGNLIWPGSYSMCRNVKIQKNISVTREENVTLSGQYCWARFGLGEEVKKVGHIPPSPLPLALQTALCVPDSCSENSINSTLYGLLNGLSEFFYLTGVSCIPNSNNLWNDKGAVACFVIICLFAAMLIVGTAYDVFYYRRKYFTSFKYSASLNNGHSKNEDSEFSETVESSETEKHINGDSSFPNGDSNLNIIPPQKLHTGICGGILLSFSVYSNGAKILSLAPGRHSLRPLNGIRFFSMTWIIMGHTFLFGALLVDNPKVLLDVMKTFSFQIVSQATLAVDSFFVLSGLLVAYLFCKEYEYRNGKVSWLKFYIHRYWRLTPVYLLVLVLLRNNLSQFLSDGPFWPRSGFEGDNCAKNWWWNILYINNFISIKDMCMGYSWYLANDMQFYILSPLLLIPLVKKSVPFTIVIAGVFILISSISSGVLSSHYNITAVIDLTKIAPNSEDYNILFDVIYDKPYCRIGAYIIGMICGWLLNKTKCRVELRKCWVILGWTIAIACNLGVAFGLYHSHPSQAVSSLYFALCRIGWSLGLCWLIFACCTGYGGMINSFLSWPLWNPFSRLTYSVYLIHVIVIEFFFYSSEVIGHFSYTSLIFSHFAFVIVSYLLGLVISLMFEAPFLAMEKLILDERAAT